MRWTVSKEYIDQSGGMSTSLPPARTPTFSAPYSSS